MLVKIGDTAKDIRAIWMEGSDIVMIDQRVLPQKLEFYTAKNTEQLCNAIKSMIVRGAPAIGVAGAYGIVQAKMLGLDIVKAGNEIKAQRPTAHDLFYAVDVCIEKLNAGVEPEKVAEWYAGKIIEECRRIGEAGEKLVKDGMHILTHCNAGALATVDWGTALAVLRMARRNGKKFFVYVDETRPRLQGAKLTSWELLNEGIEHVVIADNAAGYYMAQGEVDLVITGADRIALNGDFANKIGTYEKAVLAKENKIPFYVAAPRSTFDFSIRSGKEIVVEERDADEVHYIGNVRVTPDGAKARNPAFDVTPARYVTGFVTAHGVFKPEHMFSLKSSMEREK